MKGDVDLVIFTLDESRFALKLAAVDRVVRVVEITPLPKAPDFSNGSNAASLRDE